MKRSRMKKKPDGREWHIMALNTHRNANGFCDRCGEKLPLGTPPAHRIPRKKSDPSLDEDFNLALMGWMGCYCHTKFDEGRGKFYSEMLKEDEPCILLQRILAHPRLKEYMDQELAIWEVKQEQEGRI